MKNSINLCAALLLLAVLGCGCPGKLAEIANKGDSSTPRPATSASPDSTTSSKGNFDVTKAKYDQIRNGMSLADVERIFGGKGEQFYNGKASGSTFTSFKWAGENYTMALVSFRDDKVTSKSQVGLK